MFAWNVHDSYRFGKRFGKHLRLEIDMGGDIDGPEDLVHRVAGPKIGEPLVFSRTVGK